MFDASNKIPGGGLVSTARDLVEFAVAFENGKLVSAATRARMLDTVRTKDGKEIPYGLGWYLLDVNGARWVWHAGIMPGVSTYLLVFPLPGFSVALLANLEGVNLGPLAARIAGIAGPASN